MIIRPSEYDHCIAFVKSLSRPLGNPRNSTQKTYKDVLLAFDIETTRLEDIEQSVMYIWMLHIHHHYTIIGREWSEFFNLLKMIKDDLNGESVVVYVHNLSYEFQYISGLYDFSTEEVFAIDRRKVLKCTMYNGAIEFRCSYLHSNMSLSEYTYKMGVEHVKQSGEKFDYSKKRYPWTTLTAEELKYCIHDVVGLCEAIEKEMESDGDTLYTIPFTSTGYVRRDVKNAMRSKSHNFIVEQYPDYETYTMLREAFRGGDTHANRYFAGQTLVNVHSYDRSSSYPECLCNCLYPISVFRTAKDCDFDRLMKLMTVRKKAMLMRVKIWNLKLRNIYDGAPYLSKDKCRNIVNDECCGDGFFDSDNIFDEYDNGRILRADYLETTLTDIDLKIVVKQYSFSHIETILVKYARYGKLPEQIINVVLRMYRDKTELKGINGQEVYYMKSKNKLNSVYGMMAQNPVKQSILYSTGDWENDTKDVEDLLSNGIKKAFLVYQWGVWTTAHARKALRDGIDIVGSDFVYCDTDSVKYVGDHDFTEYNNAKMKESLKSGAYAVDKNGKTHYMGVYEQENDYDKFRTLGAKKYVYMQNGKLYTTIAGVSKKIGGDELSEKGGIEAFKTGFTFSKAGGTESIYNDDVDMTIVIEGHTLHITKNVVIKDSTYTVGCTGEYERVLKNAKRILTKNSFCDTIIKGESPKNKINKE